MAEEAPAFRRTCEVLEAATELSRAQVRGTVRLALKEAGFTDAEINAREMRVVARTTLAAELGAGGVDDAQAVCEAVAAALEAAPDEGPGADSPDAIFARLGRG